ncbi:hypothetical protein U1839_13125 [Sphingomonas sp. RT2P30]|uniref:hypothetical protein n=1 Tax=Parasphingomonas halimpatiens TaxID=3096162 RepID=UPI002FCC0308
MIIVPIEENHSGLASATDAKFRTPDMSGSGLEALGAGLAKLGDGGQQFATALDEKRRRELAAEIAAAHLDVHHQRNLDDAAAKKAYVDYSDRAAALLQGDNGILNHEGADAHAAFPALVAALADSHDEATAPLNALQRAVVGPALGERLRSDVARAAAHVRQQGVVEQQSRSSALQVAAARDAVAHADQPDLHDHHMATGENAIRQQAMIGGTSDDELGQQLADYRSGVHADTIEALSARDPASAVDWYGRFGDNLNEVDKRRVATMLAPVPSDGQLALDDNIAGTSGSLISFPSDESAGSAFASDRNLSDVVDAADPAPTPSPTPVTNTPRTPPVEAADPTDVAADGVTPKRRVTAMDGTRSGTKAAQNQTPIISDSDLAALRVNMASPKRQASNRARAEADLRDPVVLTLLHMIAYYEGPDRANGYAQIQGKLKKTDPKITDFSRFPNIGEIAGGRYQIERTHMYATGVQNLGIESFHPVDQDMIAAYVLRHYGITDKIKAGDFAGAMPALATYWRSFPLPGDDAGKSGNARGNFATFVKIFNEVYPLVRSDAAKRAAYESSVRYLNPFRGLVPGLDQAEAKIRPHINLIPILDKYNIFKKPTNKTK